MREHHITADAAFAILRQTSQNSNTKIADIAARLIHITTGSPPQQQPPLG
jgi:AmiR/NasT family two-component response regulator